MIRPAASLLICAPIPLNERRKGESDFKILLMKRNARGLFGSLHVFPGGAVDAADSNPEWGTILKDTTSQQTSSQKDILSYAVAAVRETFEECGIALLKPSPSWSHSEATQWREMVHNDAKAFPKLCKTFNTIPNLPKLIHWAHWITPEIEKKRFDTQFFLTVLPEYVGGDKDLAKALVSADGQETLFLEWMTPKDALDAFSKGGIITENIFFLHPYLIQLH
ncbi:hypothetical protein BC829DRAFT_282144 [Chytridium lagenaria]|nr:hypothetical protein BC829DRAFT_282144 [Chytridium lagenaria]